MHEIQPTGELAHLLETYKNIGGKVDYVLIGELSFEATVNISHLHKAAAAFTIETAMKRYPSYWEHGSALRIEPTKAQSRPIEPDEFFARGYIWVKVEDISSFPYFSPEEKQSYLSNPNVEKYRGVGYYFNNYHYAFSYPPYHPHGFGNHEEERLFSAINQQLFGERNGALSIYRWTTDWADYFNPGNEWWGSFLWTVYHPELEWVVGIAASQSD